MVRTRAYRRHHAKRTKDNLKAKAHDGYQRQGYYYDNSKGRIVRISRNKTGKNNVCTYWKQQANKAIRRYKGLISDGKAYTKVFEYEWSVW